jgi:protein SERAC1
MKTEVVQTEIARALANIFAGATNLSQTAAKAADSGLVGLLSQWASGSQYAAGGHLQIESFRALHNLSEAICPGPTDDGQRRVWINGLLPLQPPSLGVAESDQRKDTDVVFVHGLRGGPLRTWRCRPGRSRADEVALETGLKEIGANSKPITKNSSGDPAKAKTIWPRDWLSKDAPRCRISSVGHDAGVLRGGLGRGMIGPSLADRASDIRIALHRSGVGQEGRKVVFVTHSYGGLLVKEVLTQDPALWSVTKGILFLGVPHFGSPIAGTLAGSSRVVLSSAVRELYPDESGALARLNEAFCAAVASRSDEVTIMSFGEGELLELGGRHGRPTVRLDLVPPNSANPRVGHFEILEGVDHVILPKPFSREDAVYQAVLGLTLKQADSATMTRRASLEVVEPDVDASGA